MMGTNGHAYINALIRLKGGEAAIPAFRAALARVTGRHDIDVWDNSEKFGDPVRRVTAYEAACLLAFGLAALAAALFLIGQSVARYISATVPDLQVLQAVGMTRPQAIAAASAGPFLAGLAGGTLGVAGAAVASRWMPIGVASIAEPHPGIEPGLAGPGPGMGPGPAPGAGRLGGRGGGRAVGRAQAGGPAPVRGRGGGGRRELPGAPGRGSTVRARARPRAVRGAGPVGPGRRGRRGARGAGRLHLLGRCLRCGQPSRTVRADLAADHVLRLQRPGCRAGGPRAPGGGRRPGCDRR